MPTPADWDDRRSRTFAAAIGAPGRGGAPLLLLFNADTVDVAFALPPGAWVCELDSTAADGCSNWRGDAASAANAASAPNAAYPLRARSVVLLRDAAPTAGPSP